MAFTNGDIYNTVLFLANKTSLSGYLTIPKFSTQLKKNNIALLREYLGLSNDWQLGYSDSIKKKGQSTSLDDVTNVFKKKETLVLSGGVSQLPTDYFRYDSLRVNGAYQGVEILFGSEMATRLGSFIDEPDPMFPVAEFIENDVYLYPNTITSAELIYYKKPTTPIFDYYLDVDGNIVYMDAGTQHVLLAGEVGSAGQTSGTMNSLSVESEFPDDAKIDLAYMIARDFGINISRQDITQYANQVKQGGN